MDVRKLNAAGTNESESEPKLHAETQQAQLSPLGWDRINLTGYYVRSDRLDLDAEGIMPLLGEPYRESLSR